MNLESVLLSLVILLLLSPLRLKVGLRVRNLQRRTRLALAIVYWGHEPLAVPRRTESADKSDALQTLRARGRVSGRRVSVWSACVFSAAFARQATIRWPSRFMEKIRARIQWLLALGLSIQLAGGYCAENPQTTGLHVGAAAVD